MMGRAAVKWWLRAAAKLLPLAVVAQPRVLCRLR